MYSRRLKVEEKENKRKAIGFGLLTIGFVAFMIFYGLPLLAQVSNFTYDLRKSSEPVESTDKTPPAPPRFNNLPNFVNKDKLEISGNTESGVKVSIHFNNQNQEVVADAGGSFNSSFTLKDGENILYAYAIDQSGNKSHETEAITIVLDKKIPELTVNKPTDGSQFVGNKQKQITVQGQTEKDTEVQINGRHVVINSDFSFSYVYGLDNGTNILNIKAQDLAGNTTEKSITVNYTP